MSTRDYSYHMTRFEDGGIVIHAGDALKMNTKIKSNEAFSTCIVLGIAEGTHGDFWVRLARPYAFASCPGTTCATALVGCEVFEITTKSLAERYTKVGQQFTT